jgi:hypothetical protein
MIGLLLLYFIGKYFAELAEKYNKTKWPYVILGIAMYYASAFVFGLILGLIQYLTESNFLDGVSDIAFSLISVPVGILGCWLTYILLKFVWEKKALHVETDILDQH